jgi:RNA polymerase sigma factor (sigma-70 family)
MGNCRNHRGLMDDNDEREFRAWSAGALAPLVRFAFALTHHEGGAEDLVESALVRTLLSWPEVVAATDPEYYARRMMVEELASAWRRPRAAIDLTVAAHTIPASEFTSDDAELVERDRVWRELVDLPPRPRAVIVMRAYEDRSDADIATILGCSIETVRTEAEQAIAILRSGEIVERRVSR